MTGHHLEITPLSRHRWVVRYEGDPTTLSEHETLSEARSEARNHARQLGERVIHVIVEFVDMNYALAELPCVVARLRASFRESFVLRERSRVALVANHPAVA